MPCFCDADPPDVWHAKDRTARCRHVCDECREVIEPGDRYTYHAMLYDGEWEHYHMCEFCEHDAKIVSSAGLCWTIGELENIWKEMWD